MPNNKGYLACMLYLIKSVAFNNDNRQKDKLIYRSTVVGFFFSFLCINNGALIFGTIEGHDIFLTFY